VALGTGTGIRPISLAASLVGVWYLGTRQFRGGAAQCLVVGDGSSSPGHLSARHSCIYHDYLCNVEQCIASRGNRNHRSITGQRVDHQWLPWRLRRGQNRLTGNKHWESSKAGDLPGTGLEDIFMFLCAYYTRPCPASRIITTCCTHLQPMRRSFFGLPAFSVMKLFALLWSLTWAIASVSAYDLYGGYERIMACLPPFVRTSVVEGG